MNECVQKAQEQIDDVELYTKIHTKFGKLFLWLYNKYHTIYKCLKKGVISLMSACG